MKCIKCISYTNELSGLMTIPKPILEELGSPRYMKLNYDEKTKIITLEKLEMV
jgi:hypothetical protein